MALTREQRAEINRRNSRNSTGPRTPHGKAASRANAMKHGLTSRELAPVSPEEANEYDQRRQLWHDDLSPRNVIEAAMVDRACRANWKLDLCARHDDALRAARQARVPGEEPLTPPQRLTIARRHGNHLLLAHERPTPPDLLPPPGEYNFWNDPAGNREKLRGFAEGVAWLLSQWDRTYWFLNMQGRHFMNESPAVIADRRIRAVRLLGFKSEDELEHPLLEAAKADMKELEALYAELTEGPGAPPDTGLDLDPELLMRYEAAAERELHRAVNTFLKLRKDPELIPPPDLFDLEPEPEPEPDSRRVGCADHPSPSPSPSPEPEPAAPAPGPKSEPTPASSSPPVRNEAIARARYTPCRPFESSRRGSRRPPGGA